MEVIIARPEGYDLDPEDMDTIRNVSERNGGSVVVTDDQAGASEGADVIYAKSWGRLDLFGRNDEEIRGRAALKSWTVTDRTMAATRDGRGIFMHCLPIRRNVIASDTVLDGPNAAVIDQAENRLHAQRALLLALLQQGSE